MKYSARISIEGITLWRGTFRWRWLAQLVTAWKVDDYARLSGATPVTLDWEVKKVALTC